MENTTMSPISIHSTAEKYIISIDKDSVSKERLQNFVDMFRLEILGKEVAFDASIEKLGEQIKKEWWTKNKEWLLNRER